MPHAFARCCLVLPLVAVFFGSIPPQAAAADVDTSPLTIKVEPALADVEWTGWEADRNGVDNPLRPILLTDAGDGSGRVFVPTQQGVIYVLSSPTASGKAGIFLDLSSRVAYDDKTNEEGFLGLAFHPKFRQNGRLYAYYTNKNAPHQNVIASFRVSASDPNRAELESEEILLVLDKPFWNHDGGTIVFGPDGMLYVAVGDGGLRDDPFGNGQKLDSLLGKILRIDVDHPADGQKYGIPSDNPFARQADARPEVWAYGLRNVWRMAFDRATGELWAGDVGQDIWEEIDLIVKGGNYGWNLREGMHTFGKKGVEARADLIEPIFEYNHDVGKSITGGLVYRGKQVPQLAGAYLYADYVTGKVWALWYDAAAKRVTANREIPLTQSLPIMSFGEDESGEAYFMTYALTGQGIYRFAATAARPAGQGATQAKSQSKSK